MKFGFVPVSLWYGTEESYVSVVNAMESVAALEIAGQDALKTTILMRGGGRGDDPFAMPPMWHMEGDTAVVSIAGSLINGSAGFMRLFGVTGYDDVKAAISEALKSKDAKRIVLSIDSGGGDVAGVEDAGTFIRKAASLKPVLSFTDGMMASAAYWLGSSADAVYSNKTAMVGSVGTLIVHTEYSKMLADDGIKKTLVRYGKFKALANPYEPLSEDAKEHLENMAAESGKIFVEYVAERRDTTPEKFQKTMGEGRVFMGRQAADVGLTDGVMSYEDFIGRAKSLDTTKSSAQNARHLATEQFPNPSQEPIMKIRAISKAVTLAIIGGTKVEALGLSTEAANVEGVKPEAEDVTALTAEAAEIQSAFTAATAKAVDAAVATAKADSDKVVADLRDKVTLLEGGAGALSAKVTAATELAAKSSGVVKASISVMAVSLGVDASSAAALTGDALLAEHDRLAAAFKQKFPAGGVAAVQPGTLTQEKKAAVPPAEFLAMIPRAK